MSGQPVVAPRGVDDEVAASLRARVEEALATASPGFGTFLLARLLDLSISYDDDEQTCTVDLPYADFLRNPQGSLHGGVIAIAMDVSMGHLCHRFLSTSVTLEMQLRYFRPVRGAASCTARLLKPGRRIVHLESRLTDDQGRLAALATASWHRLDADPAP